MKFHEQTPMAMNRAFKVLILLISILSLDRAEASTDSLANYFKRVPAPFHIMNSDGFPTISFQPYVTRAVGPGPREVKIADLTGDGRPDVFTSIITASQLNVLPGNGSGCFNTALAYPGISVAHGLAAGDLNDDSMIDIVLSSGSQNLLGVLLNTGSGFASSVTYTASPSPSSQSRHINLADINRDGNPDILVANDNSTGRFSILYNQGAGIFSNGVDFVTSDGTVYHVAAADLDNDSYEDIITANYAGSISIFINNQSGGFNAEQVITLKPGTHYVVPADLNGDNLIDLVTANSIDNSVSVLLNQGSATFNITHFPTGNYCTSLAITDVHNDGFLDVVVAHPFGALVSVFPGDGTGDLGPGQDFAVSGQPYSVATADLNGDGLKDIVATDLTGDKLSFLFSAPVTCLPPPLITSFSPASGQPGTTVTILGSNFDPTLTNNQVLFNGLPASVTGAASNSLTAIVPVGGTVGPVSVVTNNLPVKSATNFGGVSCFPSNGMNATTVLGQPDFLSNTPGSNQNQLTNPLYIAIDPTTGKVFVADYDNNRVLRFSSTQAATTNGTPEAVLGQPDFVSHGAATTQSGLWLAGGLAFDTNGTLYVVDGGNARVLRFNNASAKPNGANADGVLGQPDFVSNGIGTSATKFYSPAAAVVDANGNLFVSDMFNSRVLRFDNAASKPNGAAADAVLGEPNFTSQNYLSGPNRMSFPRGLTIDAHGSLYVADQGNNRVLRFDHAAAIANGANADAVLGQPDFNARQASTNQHGMSYPTDLKIDANGTLYVVERSNNRVTWFTQAASKSNGANADGVIGQPDFNTGFPTTTQSGLNFPFSLGIDNGGSLFVVEEHNHRVIRFQAPAVLSSNLPVICSGTSATLTASGASGSLQTYNWYGQPSGSLALTNSASYSTPALSSATNYYVSIADAGCAFESARITVPVTVKSLPPNPGVAGGAHCGTGTVSLTANGATGVQQYKWYDQPSGGTIQSSLANFITPALTTSTSYYVAIADPATSCESARTKADAIINPVPTPPSTSAASLCGPGSLTLTASGATGGNIYQWHDAQVGGTLQSSVASLTTPVLATSTSYYVSLLQVATSCESSRTKADAIINPVPSAPTINTSGPTTFCQGSNVSLSSSAPGTAYLWSDGSTTYPRTVTSAATLTLQLTDINGCTSPASTPVTITVNAAPTAPVLTSSKSPANNIVSLCTENAESTTLSAPGGYSSYLWSSGQTTPAFTTANPGTYSLTVTNTNGCSTTSVTPLVLVGIKCQLTIATTSITVETGGTTSLPLINLVTAVNAVSASGLSIVKQPASGAKASIDATGNLVVDYSGIGFIGTETVTISACDIAGICTIQDIAIEVTGDISIYNALSPGSDGKNDIFLIDHIQTISTTRSNHVSIFNRWGSLVWEASNYDNTTIVFNGTSSDGKELPTGTYFYRIRFDSGQPDKTGFISLRR